MAIKKKFNKDKIIVVGITVVAVFLMGAFILKNSGAPSVGLNPNAESVVVSKTGEASSINFTVPSTNVKKEEGGLLDEYAKANAEALKREKENNGSVTMPDMTQGSANDKLYGGEDDEFMKNVQRQLQEMEGDQASGGNMQFNGVPSNQNTGTSLVMTEKTKLQEEMEYRQMLLDAKQRQNERSQDFSTGGRSSSSSNGNSGNMSRANNGVEFRASIYKDQLIIPGERVILILPEELTYMGNTFPKNTLIYGMANIQKNRVILEIANINHVRVGLQAYDVDDGMLGLYNEQAGALWKKYEGELEADVGSDVLRDVGRSVPGGLGRMVSPVTRAMGTFFRKKNISNREKILLVDDDQVLLKMPADDK